jgi:hypothetical protein
LNLLAVAFDLDEHPRRRRAARVPSKVDVERAVLLVSDVADGHRVELDPAAVEFFQGRPGRVYGCDDLVIERPRFL